MAKLTDFELLQNAVIFLHRIMYYSEGMTEKQLIKDIKATDAICYCSIQFGENISKISDDFKSRNSQLSPINWAFMSDFSMNHFFDIEDIWDVIYSEDGGLASFLPPLMKVYEANNEGKSTVKEDAGTKDGKNNSLIDKKYKHSIHSHSSIWTVKKR